MSTYLGRLKSVLAENTPTPLTDKTDKRASVSFVSGEGRHVSRGTPGTVGTPATARRSYPDIPDEWSEAIEQLLSRPCPEAESAERWASACRGVEQFAQQWGAKALSLGWT